MAKIWLLLADRYGHQAILRHSAVANRWERFVPEYNGGRWEPFMEGEWPASGTALLLPLGVALDRLAAEKEELK